MTRQHRGTTLRPSQGGKLWRSVGGCHQAEAKSARYELVIADPPWPYTSFGTAKLPYSQMSEDELCAFDWSRFLAKDAVVFCWITSPKMDLAFRCFEAWRSQGLHFAGLPFVWGKTKKDGKTLIGASGPRPRIVKPVAEFVAALTTTPNRRTFPLLTEKMRQWVLSPKAGRGEHSSKPKIHDAVTELYGDRPRIEIFCRGDAPPGWDSWGHEASQGVSL